MANRSAAIVGAMGILAVGLLAGRVALLLVAIAVSLAAAGEMFRLVRAHGVLPSAIVGHLGIVLMLIAAYVRGERGPAIFPVVIAGTLGLAFIALLVRNARADATRAVAFTMIPVLTIGLLGAYVISLRSAANGFRLAWVFVLMVVGAEVGATGVTAMFRRRSLTPRARRTGEHVAGALIGALLAGMIAATAASPPFTWSRAMILSVLVAAATATGDLLWDVVEDDVARVEPAVRRPEAVLLRRVDGALLAAPVFFYVFRALAR
jgi:CDP-diglyceride synthetase